MNRSNYKKSLLKSQGFKAFALLLGIGLLLKKTNGMSNNTSASLIYQTKLPSNIRSEFVAKVREISIYLRINPNWLMQVINKETGGTFSPSVLNYAGSGATGLIQFMPKTALALGTTTAKLAKMTHVEQLDYVKKYFASHRGKMNSYGDIYLATFYPVALTKPDSWLFPSRIYNQNSGLDLNKDGKISKGEFLTWINK